MFHKMWIFAVVDRLKEELEVMRRMSGLHCLHCSMRLADCQDLVQLSDEGVGAHYVNSHGVVHDMLTAKKASVHIVGDPEADHSWFPGFSWQICYCRQCRMHLGWLFTRNNGSNEDVGDGVPREEAGEDDVQLPLRFFGLRRAALTSNAETEHGDERRHGIYLFEPISDDDEDEQDGYYTTTTSQSEDALEQVEDDGSGFDDGGGEDGLDRATSPRTASEEGNEPND